MKKVFILCAFVCTTLLTFGQTDTTFSNSEIYRLISANQELNKQTAGITDPNKIQIGQKLSYVFTDGSAYNHTVAKDENQWVILKKVSALESIHGKALQPGDSLNKAKVPAIATVNDAKLVGFWWLLAIVAAFVLAYTIYALLKKRKAEAAKDPVTSGRAMRDGGVNDETAVAYATEVAARTYNRPNLAVANVTRGRMSGTNVEVYYAGEAQPKRRTFSDIVGYRGQVNVDGTEEFVYFLQGCGNDVRVGNYFSSQNITFIADEVLQPTIIAVNATEQQQTELLPHNTPHGVTADLVEVIRHTTEKMADANNGKFSLTAPGFKMEMEFNKGLLIPTNHVSEQPAAASTSQS